MLCIIAPITVGEIDKSQWKSLQGYWKRAFLGGESELRAEIIQKMAEADDVRVLPLLAHTVKIANSDIGKIQKRLAKIKEVIAKIPSVKNDKGGRTYSSEDLQRLKDLQAEQKILQPVITTMLLVKRTALSGFTNKTDEKARNWIFKKGLKNPDWEVRVGVLEALQEMKDPRADASIANALSDRDAHVRVAALSAVTAKDLKGQKDKILSMLSDKTWEVVVAALEVIEVFEFRDVATMDALIDGIVAQEGRIAEDFERVLESLTGLSYYGDGKLWERWWKANRPKYVAKQGGAAPAPKGEGETDGGQGTPSPPVMPRPPKKGKAHVTASFYGIETKSHNIIYILDVSGSMSGPAARKGRGGKKGPVTSGPGHRRKPGSPPADDGPKGDTKLDFAKYELLKSVRMLPRKAWFNIIFYNDKYEVWKADMVRATPSNKKKAYDFVNEQTPESSTNIFDAIEEAFKIAGPGKPKNKSDDRYAQNLGGADTIFLLSDGSPNAGRIPKADDILVEVRKMNKLRKIIIHTVGVGAHNVGFMKALAHENGGKYVKAD
jgi:hypothetical protein